MPDGFLTRALIKNPEIQDGTQMPKHLIVIVFSAASLISYTGDCESNTAGSLLIKLFVLVLPVANNTALKPGRAEEPQVSRGLSRQNGFASLFPKALTFRGSCLLPRLGGSWVIMEGDYWVLVGRRRHQLIISETKSSACWGG